jgi:ankyrin repeat protein
MPHIVQKMISLGWPVDAKDVWGRTPLFWAVYFDLSDIVSLLLEHGADPYMRDQDGNTPLLQSASTVSVNSITIARLLLEKVTKRQLKGTREYTLLCRAAYHD